MAEGLGLTRQGEQEGVGSKHLQSMETYRTAICDHGCLSVCLSVCLSICLYVQHEGTPMGKMGSRGMLDGMQRDDETDDMGSWTQGLSLTRHWYL